MINVYHRWLNKPGEIYYTHKKYPDYELVRIGTGWGMRDKTNGKYVDATSNLNSSIIYEWRENSLFIHEAIRSREFWFDLYDESEFVECQHYPAIRAYLRGLAGVTDD